MARNQRQVDPAITSLQKLVTLSMLGVMAYVYIAQERDNTVILPEETKLEKSAEPIKVQITDTKTGAISYSDLRAGQIVIGKWVLELAKEEKEEPKLELLKPEENKVKDKAKKPK